MDEELDTDRRRWEEEAKVTLRGEEEEPEYPDQRHR